MNNRFYLTEAEKNNVRSLHRQQASEQELEREIIFPDTPTPEVNVSGGFTDRDKDHLHKLHGGFTDKDRRMLRAIFDTVIGGGANVGGYRGGRKRALPRLGDMSSYNS